MNEAIQTVNGRAIGYLDDLEEMIDRIVERKLAGITTPKVPDNGVRNWHSVREEAQRIGVSTKTIHRWKDRGEIPFSRKKKGASVLFDPIEVDLALKSNNLQNEGDNNGDEI